MKTKMLVLFFVLMVVAVFAQLGDFQQLADGHVEERMGIVSSGENIYMVYYYQPTAYGSIVFKRSQDSGLTWETSTIASVSRRPSKPTLSVNPPEIVVTYMDNYDRKIAYSSDMGLTWEITDQGRSFEIVPFTEKEGESYLKYALDIPYPQEDQASFFISEDQDRFLLPQYHVNEDISMNDTNVYFWGPDVLTGVVRSNSDIWIRQMGGGANNGWPTFYSPVITSGTIRLFGGGNIPYEDVFMGGYIENAPTLDLPLPDRQNTQPVGPIVYSPNYIVMIEVNGDTYSGWLGTISQPENDQAFVYDPYPADPLGYPLFRNIFTTCDTLWTPLAPGQCGNRSLFVNNRLWIKGEFSGNQVWACSDTIMIIGDLTLSNTQPGQNPLPTSPDHVSLISEKSVLMKYGYKDPADGLRHHLARPDNEPFYIYADIYASGDANPRSGIFSFEYQHPHPSVPDLIYEDNFWTRVDLHRRRYPQTATQPWPSNIDYPWYNPLWPERQPYLERGTIKQYGSIIQRKRGYLHRNVSDSSWPSGGVWDINNDFCGGTSAVNYTDSVLGIQMACIHYPGVSGSGVGYKKYFQGNSFNSLETSPDPSNANSPAILWNLGLKVSNLTINGDEQTETILFEEMYLKPIRTKVFAKHGADRLYAFNEKLYGRINGAWHDLCGINSLGLDINAIVVTSETALILCSQSATDESRIIYELDMNTLTAQQRSLELDSNLSDITVLANGIRIVSSYDPLAQAIKIYQWNTDDELELLDTIPVSNVIVDNNYHKSRLFISPVSNNAIDIFVNKYYQIGPYMDPINKLFYQRLSLALESNEDELISAPLPELHLYPNPAINTVNINLKLRSQDTHRIDIYNVRGQYIRSLQDAKPDSDGNIRYSWMGQDEGGNRLGSGIYLIKVFQNDKVIISKRMCLY